MVEFVPPALMAEMRDYERTVKRLRKELAQREKKIKRMKEFLRWLVDACGYQENPTHILHCAKIALKEDSDGI